MSQRSRVIQLYKTLLVLGKQYPNGYDYFKKRVRSAFLKNKDETDPKKIEIMIAHGYYVVKELEALYMLRKYRDLKRSYYSLASKNLLYLGRDYPKGFNYFRTRLHNAFIKNSKETDTDKIEKMIAHGNYIVKELEALYMLKKYRTLKRRYYNEEIPQKQIKIEE